MGWTGIKTKQSFMDVFKEEYAAWLLPSSDNYIQKSIEVRIPPHLRSNTTDDEAEIYSVIFNRKLEFNYCHVAIMERVDNEVLIKGQDEFSGPYCLTKCPQEIVELLSPVSKLKNNDDKCYIEEFRKRQNIQK